MSQLQLAGSWCLRQTSLHGVLYGKRIELTIASPRVASLDKSQAVPLAEQEYSRFATLIDVNKVMLNLKI